MPKDKILKLTVFFFLSLAVFSTTFLLKQSQFLGRFAEESNQIVLDAVPQGKLNRIWPNFAQGGEEQKPMLSPALPLIQSLQPRYIRIDHLFDFPDLDKRVDEILETGAKPFLSLSYFPTSISPDLVTMPNNLDSWQNLVAKTIQEYSGKKNKNITDVYYEVWNEPDLFGKMTPQQYFELYRTTVFAAEKCQNCNSFKIGGPAITTLKKDWMENFLKLAGENRLRMDFVSWHSYQLNPQKTLDEADSLKGLTNFKRFFSNSELIISEWGSVPEISSLHDSYFDASHTVSAIEKLKDSIDKIFTFELVDGPSPEGKKYWGRWGLITNQLHGLTPKPRYYPFIYLEKLLEYELKTKSRPSGIAIIGSSDAKENYSLVLALEKGNGNLSDFDLNINGALPGKYQINSYFLNPMRQPLASITQSLIVNNNQLNTTVPLTANSVVLLEINRTSPALISAKGRTDLPQDSSAKITSSIPPLVFRLPQTTISQAEFSFWFKSNWNDQETEKRIFLVSKDLAGNGISVWYENQDQPKLIFEFSQYQQPTEQAVLPIAFLDRETWHQITVYFDNSQNSLGLVFDNNQSIIQTSSKIRTGETIFIGGDQELNLSAEGFIDDLSITVNQETAYQKSFD